MIIKRRKTPKKIRKKINKSQNRKTSKAKKGIDAGIADREEKIKAIADAI